MPSRRTKGMRVAELGRPNDPPDSIVGTGQSLNYSSSSSPRGFTTARPSSPLQLTSALIASSALIQPRRRLFPLSNLDHPLI